MKKRFNVLPVLAMLAACSSAPQEIEQTEQPVEENIEQIEEETLSWSDYYKEAEEYLKEKNCEEAILSFSKAIELNGDLAELFAGRGDAYVLKDAESDEEVKKNLALALKDYEEAIRLDPSYAQAYLGKADILIRQEDFEEAHDLLVKAEGSTTDNTLILKKVNEIEKGSYIDSSQQIRRLDKFDENGTLIGYRIFTYDYLGRRVSWRNYGDNTPEDGITIEYLEYAEAVFNDDGLPVRNNFYAPDGSYHETYETMEYDANGHEIRRDSYKNGEHMGYYLTYLDENGREIGYDTYYASGEMANYWRYDYDDSGNLIQQNIYDPAGNLIGTMKPSSAE